MGLSRCGEKRILQTKPNSVFAHRVSPWPGGKLKTERTAYLLSSFREPHCLLDTMNGFVGRSREPRVILRRLKGQELHAVGQVGRLADLCNELKVVHALAYRHIKLVCVNHASKRTAATLTPGRLSQQIFVLTEQHPTQFRGAVEQLGVGEPRCTIGLAVNTSTPRSRSAAATARRTCTSK